MKQTLQWYCIIFTLLINTNLFSNIIYVDSTATGSATGESWGNAYTDVTTAINNAIANDEIHIATGTYKEGATIIINKNISLLGGYPVGGGIQDIAANETILDGENSYLLINNSAETILNGIILQNGYNIDGSGAGIYNNSTITIIDSKISNNEAKYGGGIYNLNGTVTIINSIVNNNTSSGGGGILSSQGILNITNSSIKNNTSTWTGGGILSNGDGTLTIKNSIITNNSAVNSGGGIYNWGTFYLINSVISTNTCSSNGGGIYNPLGTATITNSIITKNTAISGDGFFIDIHGTINIQNSIIYENSNNEYLNINDTEDLTFEYSLVKGEHPTGTGNINATAVNFNPMFIDFNNNNYNLQYGSPLIDTGLNSFNTESLDIIGNSRITTIIDIGPYEYSNEYIIWTGNTDNDWFTTSNWDTNVLPSSTSDVIIPSNLTNYPTANTTINFNTLTIESGATFIPESTVNGTITHKKNIPDTNWHFITPTVIGETYENIIQNHSFATGTGNNIGLSTYLNSGSTPWIYFSNTTTGTVYRSHGYAIKLNATENISFTGTISGVPNRSANAGSRNGFILTGNPHTAYIDASVFLNNNTAALAENSIWLWNGSEYITYNLVNSIQIEPAEGFFIEANATNNISFSNTNRSHQNSNSTKQEPIPSIELFIEDETNKKNTKIFFVDEKTTGFDNGYDSKIYGGKDYEFAVFTELVSDNKGKKLAIQTLPLDYATVIPVGLIADAGKEITFSTKTLNLPEEVTIYLEDRKNNILTNLTENSYKTSLSEKANSVGQFYIHTSAKRLTTDEINSESISIYRSSNNEITISGLKVNANVDVYSLLGKKLAASKIVANEIHKINLPSLSSGIYVVKLSSGNNEITKKITLN